MVDIVFIITITFTPLLHFLFPKKAFQSVVGVLFRHVGKYHYPYSNFHLQFHMGECICIYRNDFSNQSAPHLDIVEDTIANCLAA